MTLARVMQASSLVRERHGLASGMMDESAEKILSPESLEQWHKTLQTGALASRGTTQISVADAARQMGVSTTWTRKLLAHHRQGVDPAGARARMPSW